MSDTDYTPEELEEIAAAEKAGLRPLIRCGVCGRRRLCSVDRHLRCCDDCLQPTSIHRLSDGRVIRGTRSLS